MIRLNNHAANITLCIFLPHQSTALALELQQEEMRDRTRFCRAANTAAIARFTIIRFLRCERLQLYGLHVNSPHQLVGCAKALNTPFNNSQQRATEAISTLSPGACAPRMSGPKEIISRCGWLAASRPHSSPACIT